MNPRPLEDYEFLSGTEISVQPAQDRCEPEDQFLISRAQLQVKNPAWRFSRRLAYSDLSARIMDDLSARFSFGSMAYEDENAYALSGHRHPEYNRIKFTSPYSDGPDSKFDKVARVDVDGVKQWIKVPKQIVAGKPDPVPGQIKLVADPDPRRVDVDADDFDGWVYADGSVYQAAFEHASYFKQVGDGFQVPDIRNMFEMNGRPYQEFDREFKAAENDVQPHAHAMKLVLDGKVDVEMSISVGTYSNKKNKGSHVIKAVPASGNFSLNLNVSGLSVGYGPESVHAVPEEGETRPLSYMLPVMVYIGRRTDQ